MTHLSNERSNEAPRPTLDSRRFRNALGKFATGVTIVTTCDANGDPVGVTANSFNSVSLVPPLILWSLAKGSRSLPAFANASEFAVHVLGADQAALSARFASRGADKFAGVDWSISEGGAPILRHCSALFRCRPIHQQNAGDHVTFFGEVVHCDYTNGAPLIWLEGTTSSSVPCAPGRT